MEATRQLIIEYSKAKTPSDALMFAYNVQQKRSWLPALLLLLLLQVTAACDADDDSIDAMDLTKSPCENFHEYACGNWHAPYGLRSLGAHDMRSNLRALNKQLLVRHFEAQHADAAVQPEQPEQLVSFYNSCMSGRQSLHVYMDAVQRVLPQWPLLNNASAGFQWARGNAAVRRFGAQGLWRLLVQPNWQAAEQRVFYLLPPTFELLGRDEQSEFLYQRYLKYLLLEQGLRVRRAVALATQLVEFERELRELTVPRPQDRAQTLVLHAPQTLQQLHAQLPQLQLNEYFATLLGEAAYTPQLLLVADVEYLRRLQPVVAATDPLILSSWLLLQLPAHFELHLHEDMLLAAQRDHCLQQVNQLLPQQLSQLLLRLLHGSNEAAAVFLQRTRTQLQQVFDTLKLQFERLLNATSIFEKDAATRQLALDKLHAMRLLLPQQAAQTTMPATTSDYDANLLRLSEAQSRVQFQHALSCLQLPCEAASSAVWDDHTLGALDVNVYYKLKLNAIALPLGLLREPLLPHAQQVGCNNRTEARTRARLLGSLGYMLGHEMLHAFDYDGINYDATGRVSGEQWPARAIIRFGLRARCYLGSRYSNATLMINENIADNEGLRLAYEALSLERPGDREAARSFFVAFAQTWCGRAVAPSAVGQQQHAPHWERVNNVLGNYPEFVETYDCTAGSLMHPPEKCRIW